MPGFLRLTELGISETWCPKFSKRFSGRVSLSLSSPWLVASRMMLLLVRVFTLVHFLTGYLDVGYMLPTHHLKKGEDTTGCAYFQKDQSSSNETIPEPVSPHALFSEWFQTKNASPFIVGKETEKYALKFIHKNILPKLLHYSSGGCHIFDVGAASYGDEQSFDYSDSLIFLELLGGSCTIHAFDLSREKLVELESKASILSPNSKNRLITHLVALSDKDGHASVRARINDTATANTWTIADDRYNPMHLNEIETLTADKFTLKNNINNLFYVKVDVQGHEMPVVYGMKNLFSEHRVTWASFEYSHHWQPGQSLEKFQDWMSKHGYATYLVGADTKKKMPFLYPLSCGYWLPELELCQAGGERRCVIDTLVVLSPSKFENDLLELTQGLKKRNRGSKRAAFHHANSHPPTRV